MKTRVTGCINLLLMYCLVGVPSTVAQCGEGGLVTIIGTREHFTDNFSASKRRITVRRSGVRYLRARLALVSPKNCTWSIIVRDEKLRVVQSFGPSDFSGSVMRWTTRVAGEAMMFDLQACSNGAIPSVGVDEILKMPNEASQTFYSVQDPNNKQFFPLYSFDEASNLQPLGDSVGFLMSSLGSESWGCSGVMITDDLFLTNWHCGRPPSDTAGVTVPFQPQDQTWKEEIARDTLIDISWDDDGLSWEYQGVECVAKNKDLDYAVIRVRPVKLSGPARPATLSRSGPQAGEQVTLIHHPAGRPKQLSACSVLSVSFPSWITSTANTDLTHRCDTEGGSSGAPLFNKTGVVVGLHHRPFTFTADCSSSDKLNKAVRIDKILSDLPASITGRLLLVP